MSSVINTTQTGYNEKTVVDNWAGEYVKRSVLQHKEKEVLDHPDGSVTFEKLDGAMQSRVVNIEQEVEAAKTSVQSDLKNHVSASDIHTTAEEKADVDTRISTAQETAEKSLQYWKPNTLYKEGQVVYNIDESDPDAIYECLITHTSPEWFSAYGQNGLILWKLLGESRAYHAINADRAERDEEGNSITDTYATKTDAEKSLQYWKPNTLYKEGQVVYAHSDDDGCDYISECLTTHTSSDSYDRDYSKWDVLISVTADQAWSSRYANKADCDIYGNSITDTYATNAKLTKKADKPTIITDTESTSYTFDFSDMYNSEMRLQAASTISIIFVDNEYAEDYISGLSFNSGETPTGFDYTDSGIINWVGTDCAASDGLSIFQPSANTHYDIVFYFNGTQFIGLVNGYVPATGNEAV